MSDSTVPKATFYAELPLGTWPNCWLLLCFKDNLKASLLLTAINPTTWEYLADNWPKRWKACITKVQHFEAVLSRYDYITRLLWDLRWLRSLEHINFKLAVRIYQCLHGLSGPTVSFRSHTAQCWLQCRRLWSSSSMQLVIWCTPLSIVGDCAVPMVAGCRTWNMLYATQCHRLSFNTKVF